MTAVPPQPPTVWEREADTLRARLRGEAVASLPAASLSTSQAAALIATRRRVELLSGGGPSLLIDPLLWRLLLGSETTWIASVVSGLAENAMTGLLLSLLDTGPGLTEVLTRADTLAQCLGLICSYVQQIFASAELIGIVGYILEIWDLLLQKFVLDTRSRWNLTPSGVLWWSVALWGCSLAVFKFAVELVVYWRRMYRGTADATDAPWRFHNLLECAWMATAMGAIESLATIFRRTELAPAIVTASLVLAYFALARMHTLCQLLRPPCNYEWEFPVGVEVDVPEDLCCPITRGLFLEPVMLGGDVFEKKELEDWIIRSGRHPVLNHVRATLNAIQPCPQMRDLAGRFAVAHGIRKVGAPHEHE